MRRDEKNIVDILEQGLPSATRQQMETARDRVLARLRAERHRGIQTPVQQSDARMSLWWRPAIGAATAAALIALVVLVVFPLRDHGLYAVLEAADSSMYRISDGNRVPLRVGDRIAALETLRSNGGAGAVLALADGSRVEMGSKSEMSWNRADDGLMVRLNTGSIIVSGAKEGTGRLYVQTKDMTASIARTTSLVNVAGDGSSVAVIEGEAHVREGAVEKKLLPGQYLSTSPTLAAWPLAEAIGWSRNADRHLAILAAFAKGMATTTGTLTPLNETAGGQTDSGRGGAADPAFDVASVRLCDPSTPPASPPGARAGGAGSFQMTRGRVHALCMTVATLIGTAYGLGPLMDVIEAGHFDSNSVYRFGNVAGRQVRGGPDWIRSDRYTIEAVANDGGDARAMSGRMLRDLLERRFHLAAHVGTEPGSAFALSVAAGGLKMKSVDADSCTPPPTPTDGVRRSEKPVCGQVILQTTGPNTMVLRGATVFSPLVKILGEILGARVIDRTDIPSTAQFSYMLEFSPDERTAGPLGRHGPAAQTSDEPRASDIFTALKEQLGLQLETAQVPRQYVVIDKIERPSSN